jgi:hypothetical protein
MDTQIFAQGLSVPAISLYILVCDMAEHGVRPTPEAVRSRFSAGPEDTETALRDLLARQILYESGASGGLSYHPNPASLWVSPGSPPE